MSVLMVPTHELLRLALLWKVVPDEIAYSPVRAAACGAGWMIEIGGSWTTECLNALTHLGMSVQPDPSEPVLTRFPCWAALLPLIPASSMGGTAYLVRVPARQSAALLHRIQRLIPQSLKYRIVDTSAWIIAHDLPECVKLEYPTYRLAGRDFWIRAGWRHPLEPCELPGPGVLADELFQWTVVSPGTLHAYPPAQAADRHVSGFFEPRDSRDFPEDFFAAPAHAGSQRTGNALDRTMGQRSDHCLAGRTE